jgi:hypothetical protein
MLNNNFLKNNLSNFPSILGINFHYLINKYPMGIQANKIFVIENKMRLESRSNILLVNQSNLNIDNHIIHIISSIR